jgi:hypothetical protein
LTHGGPGTSEKVVEDSDLMTEEHQSVDQVRTDETSTTSDCPSSASSLFSTRLPTSTQEVGLTQDPLSLRVGQKSDGGELSDGSVLDRVRFLVVDRLGSEVLLVRTNVDSLGTGLDVAWGLGEVISALTSISVLHLDISGDCMGNTLTRYKLLKVSVSTLESNPNRS